MWFEGEKVKGSAHGAGAVTHDVDAHAGALAAEACGKGRDAAAVVPYGEAEVVAGAIEGDRDAGGAGVLDGIIHGLLGDAVKVEGDVALRHEDGLLAEE